MKYLYIDIETLPDIGMSAAARHELIRASVPGNYKKPESIAAWIAAQEAADENAWTKTSVHPLALRVYMISWAIDDGPVRTLVEDYDGRDGDPLAVDAAERYLIECFAASLPADYGRLVAHNGVGFDFPALRLRAIKYGHWVLANTLPFDRWGKDADDTMHMAGGHVRSSGYSLDALAHFLGVPGKLSGMTGAGVYPAWRDGRHAEVVQYNVQDVEVLRSVHRRLLGVA